MNAAGACIQFLTAANYPQSTRFDITSMAAQQTNNGFCVQISLDMRRRMKYDSYQDIPT
jgi:hypothetical protein